MHFPGKSVIVSPIVNEQTRELNENIRQRLEQMAEPPYQKFSAKLLPGVRNILGVRLPKLRQLGKKIVQLPNVHDYLENASNASFEEVMLQGFVQNGVKLPMVDRLKYTEKLLDRLGNWSLCDSFCATFPAPQTKGEHQQLWNYVLQNLHSKKEFRIRFGAVILGKHYLTNSDIANTLAELNRCKPVGYYAQMAIAWTIAEAYMKFPEETLHYLKNNTLDTFTHNKALQKIIESHRITPETRLTMRSLKKIKK